MTVSCVTEQTPPKILENCFQKTLIHSLFSKIQFFQRLLNTILLMTLFRGQLYSCNKFIHTAVLYYKKCMYDRTRSKHDISNVLNIQGKFLRYGTQYEVPVKNEIYENKNKYVCSYWVLDIQRTAEFSLKLRTWRLSIHFKLNVQSKTRPFEMFWCLLVAPLLRSASYWPRGLAMPFLKYLPITFTLRNISSE